jgi:hypothetical protein
MAVSDALPSPEISDGNGMTFLVTNAGTLCRSKNSHIEQWTVLKAEMMSFFLMVYIIVSNHCRIPTMILNFGGTNVARHFFSHYFSNRVSLTSTWGKHSLRMGWRNFFSSCAVVSVFGFGGK